MRYPVATLVKSEMDLDIGKSSLSTADSRSLSPMRWYALAILFLVSVVNTIDKMLIPALAEPLRLEFGLSDSELGLLVGLVFSVAYSLTSVPMGLLIDRLDRTRLLSVLLIAWSLLTLLSAKTSSFFSLALCRMGVAAAESGGNPTSLSLIGDYFPASERGRAIGIFSANSAVAAVLVFSLAGVIAAEYGWRTVFLVASVPGLLLALVVFFTLKEPARGGFETIATDSEPRRIGLPEILRSMAANRVLLWLLLAAVLVIIGNAGSSAFLTAFFIRVHLLPLEQAGLITGVVMGLGFAIGTIGGGIIADRQAQLKVGGGCFFVGITTLAAVPLGVVAFSASSLVIAVPFLFFFQVLGSCFYGATLAAILAVSPISIRGSVVTYATLIMNLGGYGFGPQISGGISDLLRALDIVEPLRWALVSIVCVMALSAACYFIAGRKMRQHMLSSHGDHGDE